jgi:hypothetical protein
MKAGGNVTNSQVLGLIGSVPGAKNTADGLLRSCEGARSGLTLCQAGRILDVARWVLGEAGFCQRAQEQLPQH